MHMKHVTLIISKGDRKAANKGILSFQLHLTYSSGIRLKFILEKFPVCFEANPGE